MKKLSYIFIFILVFILAEKVEANNASGNPLNIGSEPKSKVFDPNEDKKKKVIDPEDEKNPKPTVSTQKEPVLEPDSSIHSVNKFNYIFYFIYKLKYDKDGTPEEYIEYVF